MPEGSADRSTSVLDRLNDWLYHCRPSIEKISSLPSISPDPGKTILTICLTGLGYTIMPEVWFSMILSGAEVMVFETIDSYIPDFNDGLQGLVLTTSM